MTIQNASPGPAQPVPVLKPAAPSVAAVQPVKLNPVTISWGEPKKFVTDGSTILPEEFDSYEFGCRTAAQADQDFQVVGHMPFLPGETTVAVASLSLPQTVVLQFTLRVVAVNGVRSKWAQPFLLLKLDQREPEAPSGLAFV